MSSKNISLREDVYEELKRTKGDDESFSDAIERLLGTESGEHPLRSVVGIMDDEEADALRSHVEEFRDEIDEEMERRL